MDGSLAIPLQVKSSAEGAASSIEVLIREIAQDLRLVVRSRRFDGTLKAHDMWHCITAALTATILGDRSHDEERGYTLRAGEVIRLVGTGTNLGGWTLDGGLTFALVYGNGLDRLLACGMGVDMVV